MSPLRWLLAGLVCDTLAVRARTDRWEPPESLLSLETDL